MITSKNYGAFLLVGFCAWRVMACSAESGLKFGGTGGAAPFGGNPGGGASGSGTGSFPTGSGSSTNEGTGGIILFGSGGGATREQDSSCHPVAEVPEKVIVTDSSTAPVAMFLMQDRSSSMVMGGNGASAMSWDNSVAAVTAFVQDPLSQGIDIGLGTFPAGANNTADCATGNDCGMPVVPIAALTGNAMTGNAPAIVNAYAAQRPMGLAFTPTECALRGMINTCLVYMSQSTSGEKCVAVLVTDGTPTLCDLDEAHLTQIIADGHMKGVETFTLGLPGSDLNVLNQYAQAGGSGTAIDVSGGSGAFVKALNDIRGKVQERTVIQTPLRCQWKIPAPQPDEPPLDPKQVNVQYTPPGAPPVQFGHVPSLTACPPSGNGWYYDNENTPTQVLLCPATCDGIKMVADARIDILFHCPTKPYIVQ
jgi:hypothetical protein